MNLSTKQLEHYRTEGWLLIDRAFSPEEMDAIRTEVQLLRDVDSPGRVLENDGQTVRALHGCHFDSDFFSRLVRSPRLLEPAQQILGGDVYIHQFKINIKAAFGGDVWQWHQDYIFWQQEDGVPAPDLVNIVIFGDEVNEFNGPLYLIPRSQQEGTVAVAAQSKSAADAPAWVANVSADLKYSLDRKTIARLVKQHGIVAPKGPAGSVLLFHPNSAHGSVPNISPFDRELIILTYNSVANAPVPVAEPRPEFLCAHDCTAPTPIANGAFLTHADATI